MGYSLSADFDFFVYDLGFLLEFAAFIGYFGDNLRVF